MSGGTTEGCCHHGNTFGRDIRGTELEDMEEWTPLNVPAWTIAAEAPAFEMVGEK